MSSFVRLRREDTALLMIDMQERLLPAVADQEEIMKNSHKLLSAAPVLQLPAMYTEQYPKGIGPTVKSLLDILPEGTDRFEKTAFSCCDQPGFLEKLDAMGRPVTVLFGIETHICVLSTAMDLVRSGRRAVLAADAGGSRTARNKELALNAMSSIGVSVLPTETIISQLLGASGTAEFKALLPLFK